MNDRLKTLKGKLFNKTTIYIFVVFVVLFCLCFLFPASFDDWYWGSSYGLAEFESGFVNMNGRYAGHLLVLTLTRSNILRALFISATLVGIIILSVKIASENKLILYVFATLMMLAISKDIYVQSVVWVSGFVNYVPPAFLILLTVFLMRNIFEDNIPRYSVVSTIVLFMIAVVCALFIENITIFNIVLSIAIIVFCLFKFKKIFFTHILFFVGTVIGAVIMFLNPVYGVIASGGDEYRGVAGLDEELLTTIGRNIYLTFKYLLVDNALLLVVISALCIFVAVKKMNLQKDKRRVRLIIALLTFNIGALCFISLKYLYPEWQIGSGDGIWKIICYLILALVGFTYLITIFLIIVLSIDCSKKKSMIIFFFISAFLMVAPLMIVSPIGPRCFFVSSVMLVVTVSLLFEQLVNSIFFSTYLYKSVLSSCSLIVIVYFVFTYNLYGQVYRANEIRDLYIQKQIDEGNIEVIVCKQLYPDFVETGDPVGNYENIYKDYNSINENIKFVLLDYDDFQIWKQEYDKMHTSQ